MVRELESYGVTVHVHDPVAEAEEAMHEYGVKLVAWDDLPQAHAIVAAVSHQQLVSRPMDEMLAKLVPGGLYVDVKAQADRAALEARGIHVWRL